MKMIELVMQLLNWALTLQNNLQFSIEKVGKDLLEKNTQKNMKATLTSQTQLLSQHNHDSQSIKL